MALLLHIVGPGVDVQRRLEAGAPPIVLGRDADCAVRLPDPDRNVSRRHLSVWNEGDELHFHVLSVVNGVDMPFGEAPPGARGVLPVGQVLKLAAYTVRVEAAAPAAQQGGGDPWSVFDRDGSGIAPVPPGLGGAGPARAGEPDPFGDWGFETTFGADMPGTGALQASKLAVAADLQPFFRGLGVDPAQIGALSEGELETIGRLVRAALLGLRALRRQMAGGKKELHAEDRTLLASARQEDNPFKTADWPDEIFLRYLFGGRAASAGFIGPERAVREVVGELTVHEAAAAAAARAGVEGVLREFDPETLKSRLVGNARLFESARAWEAFGKEYARNSQSWDAWVEQLLQKHFTEAYVRESLRVKRDTPPRSE